MNLKERTRMPYRNTTLDDLAEVIGFTPTLRLAAWFSLDKSKEKMYVPANVNESQLIPRLVGMSVAERLAKEFPNELLAIPSLRQYDDTLRKRRVALLLGKGLNWGQVSQLENISERRVQQLCRELEQAGLIDALGPVEKGQ